MPGMRTLYGQSDFTHSWRREINRAAGPQREKFSSFPPLPALPGGEPGA